jgi:hypothetical protein
MDTLKVAGFGLLMIIALMIATMIGYSRFPESDLCQATYRIVPEKTWEPTGWEVEDGFPRSDCELPPDKIVRQDGTWEWK